MGYTGIFIIYPKPFSVYLRGAILRALNGPSAPMLGNSGFAPTRDFTITRSAKVEGIYPDPNPMHPRFHISRVLGLRTILRSF